MRILSAIFALLYFSVPLYSRGIPLDSVYITFNSPEYQKLLLTRLDYYQSINAQYIDSNVAYAGWINGKEIIYIRETGSTCTIIRSSITTRKKITLHQFKGTVVSARISDNGRYIAVKYFRPGKIPAPSLLLFDIERNKLFELKTSTVGADYSFSDDGNTFFYKANTCIKALLPDSSLEKQYICSNHTPQWNETTVVYFRNQHVLFISGSSGSYDVFMQTGKSWNKIATVLTPLEVCMTNGSVIYTSGYPGNYAVSMYTFNTGKTHTIMSGSFNPCLQVSGNTAVFLHNAFITVYDTTNQKLYKSVIESDEASISPDGFSVATLLYGRLCILPLATVIAIDPKAKRYLTSLEMQYSLIAKNASIHNSPYTKSYIQQKQVTISSLLKLF